MAMSGGHPCAKCAADAGRRALRSLGPPIKSIKPRDSEGAAAIPTRSGATSRRRRQCRRPMSTVASSERKHIQAGASSTESAPLEHGTCRIVERPSKLDGTSIIASMVVYATVDQVIKALTDYKRLPGVIPNLVDCQILSTPATGVTRLRQVARIQSGLWKLEADAVLDVSTRKLPLGAREVRFALHGGSFKRLSGRWLAEPDESVATGVLTRISYEVDAEPYGNIEISDVQKTVRSVLAFNLFALGRHIESVSQSRVPGPRFLGNAMGEAETPTMKPPPRPGNVLAIHIIQYSLLIVQTLLVDFFLGIELLVDGLDAFLVVLLKGFHVVLLGFHLVPGRQKRLAKRFFRFCVLVNGVLVQLGGHGGQPCGQEAAGEGTLRP